MKIIVAGGRDFFDEAYMIRKLEWLISVGSIPEDLELVCGMAKGADLTAKKLFESNSLKVYERPADWKDMSEPCVVGDGYYGKYNKLAGMKRNHSMGDEAEVAIVFWNGKSKGSKDMIDYMKKLGKPVYVFNY